MAKEVTLVATDAEIDSLNYHVVSDPAHGNLEGTGANLTYTPDPDFSGEDLFTFKANDGKLIAMRPRSGLPSTR